MARFDGRIETREQMESCLRADCSDERCDTYLVAEERERFLRMYDAYCVAAEQHIGRYYELSTSQRWNGWVDNFAASGNAFFQAPMAGAVGLWYGSSGGLGEAWRQAVDSAGAAAWLEMQKGCDYTAEAIFAALSHCDRPRGWHALTCSIGRAARHIAAAACHAPLQKVAYGGKKEQLRSRNDAAELVPYLQANGYVFDPWLRGRPDVYTVPGWQDTVSLFFVQLHWDGGRTQIKDHVSPQREAPPP